MVGYCETLRSRFVNCSTDTAWLCGNCGNSEELILHSDYNTCSVEANIFCICSALDTRMQHLEEDMVSVFWLSIAATSATSAFTCQEWACVAVFQFPLLFLQATKIYMMYRRLGLGAPLVEQVLQIQACLNSMSDEIDNMSDRNRNHHTLWTQYRRRSVPYTKWCKHEHRYIVLQIIFAASTPPAILPSLVYCSLMEACTYVWYTRQHNFATSSTILNTIQVCLLVDMSLLCM